MVIQEYKTAPAQYENRVEVRGISFFHLQIAAEGNSHFLMSDHLLHFHLPLQMMQMSFYSYVPSLVKLAVLDGPN